MNEIINQFPWFPYVLVFGTTLGLIVIITIPFILSDIKKRQRNILAIIHDLMKTVDDVLDKVSPIINNALRGVERTKECPNCRKSIDEAYGECPFCSHEFTRQFFLNIIGPGDEATLDMAAEKLSHIIKTDFHEIKHHLRRGFDYAISDHTKRREFMTALEKMGCTVKEVIKWI